MSVEPIGGLNGIIWAVAFLCTYKNYVREKHRETFQRRATAHIIILFHQIVCMSDMRGVIFGIWIRGQSDQCIKGVNQVLRSIHSDSTCVQWKDSNHNKYMLWATRIPGLQHCSWTDSEQNLHMLQTLNIKLVKMERFAHRQWSY